jgi:tetratricopeptide (TPR) repeat protein
METIILNQQEYHVNPNEFIIQPHAEYNNLKIYPKVGELERIIGLLNDLTEKEQNTSISIYGWNFGGFVPIGCSKVYKDVYVFSDQNILKPINKTNIHFNNTNSNPFAIYVCDKNIDLSEFKNSYIVSHYDHKLSSKEFVNIPLYESDLTLWVPIHKFSEFWPEFKYYFDEERNFKYDNLIHLCIMVKNAGPIFETVLRENLPIIDRWTILDTGSTDGTQDIVRRVLNVKKGNLYEEPFINFRDSRNRCLDLAGKHCKYLLMLDDTYALRNDLRQFLNTVRGDQFASSYSLLIKSDDTEYYSNRITMSERELRYIYTIHEVIQFEKNKENVVIPKNAAYIHDHRADYMEKRTMDRKQYDLKLLYDMVKEDPNNPRHYYYLAQTYNLLEDYDNAAIWFHTRAVSKLEGHIQEAVDSWFELGRIYNFKLNRPWEECMKCYEECYKMDPTRPEALYFIGIHYYLEEQKEVAFDYFKRAFTLGYPVHAQFSLKPTLVFHYLPKFLAELCYTYRNWNLGLEASKRYLENNNQDADGFLIMRGWYDIFSKLIKVPTQTKTIVRSEKPLVVFVADGGWGPWTGSDILTKGVGGSETYIIEIARWVQALGKYKCVVFCKCEQPEVFEGVEYIPLENYAQNLVNNKIHSIFISRFSEYIPMTYEGMCDRIYLILHDISPSGVVIPVNSRFQKVICLTNWHVDYFIQNFPMFKDKSEAFYYGVDIERFKPEMKVRNSFIYSSFPNRGLLPLLQMWPKIKRAIPDATLNVYSDINGKWVNEVAKDQMDAIREILAQGLESVTVHGWVSKDALAKAWSKADIWLYPCIFQETFCLTALEAAATKTLAIGTPLAALNETIGDRGILIQGDPIKEEWQNRAVDELVSILNQPVKKTALIEKNYQWALESTWKQRGKEFMEKYLDSEQPDMAGMYGWIHDLPVGGNNRKKFEEALAKINPKRILEIGTYAGNSLIEMLKLYPSAKGVAIDAWKNYDEDQLNALINIEENDVEQTFYENIEKAGMKGRIKAIKGDSVEKLIDLIEAKDKFDFIYVDGSHKCLDCYVDMVLAWRLLNQGGCLAVDDVLYREDRVEAGDYLGYPLKGKLHFMEKYRGQYEIISDSYRLFVRKL